MATTITGGGSGAVAASSHAACARFRGTDPLITGVTRRSLATAVGFKDDSGGIPEARWMRAMTFERLVRDKRFASEVATRAVGRLGLDRPTAVVIANGSVNEDETATQLQRAHDRAVHDGAATMLYGLAVPFVGFETARATDVKPDFAVVAPMVAESGADITGSWLIMGDAKDYERHRSRIDDQRLLKGFLQVALGAESASHWSRLPAGMEVHNHGFLAVPRNAFLQPEALVEDLEDHRAEVRLRVAERRSGAAGSSYDEKQKLTDFVAHLHATFDPATCTSCTLFAYCRHELRTSKNPADLLIELGVPTDVRPHVLGLVDGSGTAGTASESVRAMITATLDGRAQLTGQLRIDQAGAPGTVNVVIAKSDSAALGVYGMAVQRVTATGRGEWRAEVFDDPQSATTRRAIMKVLGRELTAVMKDRRRAAEDPDEPSPVHLVVPDKVTGDVLASIADNLAGVELSRLRWAHDRAMGRKPLTFNGEPAQIPSKLSEAERTAVSFLLEDDRARAFTLRSPIVDVRAALARHVVAGGPAVASMRLDYLVSWAEGGAGLDHREVQDRIEGDEHTPGARLTNRRSDATHEAFVGKRRGSTRPAAPAEYDALVRDELAYKCTVLTGALNVLDDVPDSTLREIYRAIEGDAQLVWRRRLSLHASDLVRFGRTYRHWRNSLVPSIEGDGLCSLQLLALANPQAALDAATDAGNRAIARATVLDTDPLTLTLDSRRMGDGSRIVLLHLNGEACVEGDDVEVKFQKGSFKFSGLSIGPLSVVADQPGQLMWAPDLAPALAVGDELIVADFTWFSDLKGNKYLPIARPPADNVSAPTSDCTPESYADDPHAHQYCCRPHENAEADWADQLAGRRARGELNPDVWPPIVDSDAFEVSAADAPQGDPTTEPAVAVPDDVTMDDLDL